MAVDATKDKVYVFDIDAELSESDDERPVFLPDIERKFMKIPKNVLTAQSPGPPSHTELVLYNIPSSLTVPQEQDNVRKVILETRARAHEQSLQRTTVPAPRIYNSLNTNGHIGSRTETYPAMDPDAMEIE